MHPLFSALWIKLSENFISQIEIMKGLEENKQNIMSHLTMCFLVIREINKHGYAHRSELVVKQKDMQKKWVLYFKIKLFSLFILLMYLNFEKKKLSDIETMLQALQININQILSRNENNIENVLIKAFFF